MPKPIIAIDADDTIFDETTACRLFMNATYGTKHTAADYMVPADHENYYETVWNVGHDEAMRRYDVYVEHKRKGSLAPLPGALSVLKKLEKRYDLVVVTARDHRTVELTHDDLAKHYPDIFKDVHFVPLWGGGEEVTKAKICNDIGASFLIDDSFSHCELAVEAGVEALLFGNYGWNHSRQTIPGMHRAIDWAAVEAYFDARG